MGYKLENITGQVFGRLTARYYQEGKWQCYCECGGKVWVVSSSLKRGLTQSCGCILKEKPNRLSHGKTGSREYHSWQAMKQRCLYPNSSRFHSHGGRGITICEEWMSFENFYDDMGKRPEGTSLERRDNDGNYEPNNCYWATPTEQASNTRQAIHWEVNGITDTQAGWARRVGITPATLTKRLKKGWTIEEALFGK